MPRTARTLALPLAALWLLFGAGRVGAQTVVVSPPAVTYYAPTPAVTYYSPPVVFTPAPRVAYSYGATVSYYGPSAVSYYTPPAVTYYTPSVSYYAGPAAVTTTRYGLFGRPRVSTTYYPPVYVSP
jgi:hypothetical protein